MNQDKFKELIGNVAAELAGKNKLLFEKSEFLIAKELETMKGQGKILELSEDEIDMIKSYRAFIMRSKPESIFSWKSPNNSELVFPTEEPILIRNPREMSGVTQ